MGWTKPRAAAGAALLALGAIVGSACVGDDPAVGAIPAGERGGACLAGAMCTGTALACVDGLCLLPGDPKPGSDAGAGTSTDGAAAADGRPGDDASGDAGPAPDAGVCPRPAAVVAGTVQCNTAAMSSCTGGNICCSMAGVCVSPTTGCAANPHQCESRTDCSANAPVCCMTTATQPLLKPGSCPSGPLQLLQSQCVPLGQCVDPPESMLCAGNDVCPGTATTCKAAQVVLGATGARPRTITVGVCAPN